MTMKETNNNKHSTVCLSCYSSRNIKPHHYRSLSHRLFRTSTPNLTQAMARMKKLLHDEAFRYQSSIYCFDAVAIQDMSEAVVVVVVVVGGGVIAVVGLFAPRAAKFINTTRYQNPFRVRLVNG